ncbi:MAG TPA: peptidylprolyl isomerase, partial [Elusimicrobiales bacterium]|nr:peptidylprolyl isomerase [Elusimicrobiales bacterium]
MRLALFALLTVLAAPCGVQAALPAPKQQTQKQPAAPNWVVKINGSPVTKEAVSKRLWASYAAQVVQTFIDEKLLRQEADKLKVSVKPLEVERIFEETEKRFGKEGFRAEMFREGMTLEDFRQRIELRLLTEAVVVKKAGITVSDEDVRQFFEKEKNSLGRSESVRLRRLLVKTEAEAKDAIAQLEKGASFQDLAAKISLDERTRAQGGDMGVVERGMLLPEVEKTVFAIPAGGLSQPISDSD